NRYQPCSSAATHCRRSGRPRVPHLPPRRRGIRHRDPQGAGDPRLGSPDRDRRHARVHQGRDQPARHHRADRRPAPEVRPGEGELRRIHRRHHPQRRAARGRHRRRRGIRRGDARAGADPAGARVRRLGRRALHHRPRHPRRADARPRRHRTTHDQPRHAAGRPRHPERLTNRSQTETTMKLVNLKVATRLALGFAVVVIGALLLGASGWYGIHRQSQVITTVIDRDVQFLRAITSIRARVQLLRRYEKDMLLNVKNAAKVTEYRGKWNESRKRMDELLVNARAVAATPEESKRLEQFTANVARYTAAMAQIEEHLASGFIVSSEQGNQKVDEFRQVIRDTEDLTQELFEGANKRIEGSKPVLAAAERDVMLALAVVMLAVLVLAALAAILITRSITGPVQEAVRVAEALAKGDLTQKVEARSNDELGRLMLALRGTVGQLASIVGRIKETSDM